MEMEMKSTCGQLDRHFASKFNYDEISVKEEIIKLFKSSLLDASSNPPQKNCKNLKFYSKWPIFLNLNDKKVEELEKDKQEFSEFLSHSLNLSNLSICIENFEVILNLWSSSKKSTHILLYKLFQLIYEVKFKENRLYLHKTFAGIVKSWLNDDECLLRNVYNQKLIAVYNNFTYEENVFNTLRNKRPLKKNEIDPKKFYDKIIKETEQSCDFCVGKFEKNTAWSPSFGRFQTTYSYSASNVFPFDQHQHMFMPNNHDLTQLTFDEFKDFISLPLVWFDQVREETCAAVYPTLTWDFLYSGGASQIHPHVQCTVNEDRYYGSFETVRRGAEQYFRLTSRNYFNDFTLLHNLLGLCFTHKNAVMIFPLTPKKDYDVTILSSDFNDGVVELIYGLLKAYELDFKVYAFSLVIYYPCLDSDSALNGRIPLYVKVIPRGELTSTRSDVGNLELLATFNVNVDQFEVARKLKKSVLDKINFFLKKI